MYFGKQFDIYISCDLYVVLVSHPGNGDMVVCFYCGVETGHWKASDIAAERHARVFPDCQYLIKERGLDFIRSILERLGPYTYQPEVQRLTVSMRYIRPRYDTAFMQAAISNPRLNFSSRMAKDVITHRQKVNSSSDMKY